MNQVQPAQHNRTQATSEHPNQFFPLTLEQWPNLISLPLLAGVITLLAAWATPSQASTAARNLEPYGDATSVMADADPTIQESVQQQSIQQQPAQQQVSQRGTPLPTGTPAQPQNFGNPRSVIITPTTPNRTIVPPPTSAFPYEESYTLGPSDQIQVDIFDVPELSGAESGRYIVQLDGTINLVWAGPIRAQGLTLQQVEQEVARAYAPYVKNPRVTVSLIETRSLRISLAGEVKRPGVYVISPEGATDNLVLVQQTNTGGGVANQWPTVTKALQTAGGVTQFADLRRVQVRRPLPDGSLELIDVNLWELLRTGELNQDIRLRDRDTLVVPTATTLNDSEALVVGSANFAPDTIRVNVIGQVPNPGLVEVDPNTPMNQALMAAGGFLRPRARTSKVELVRLNSNGTAVRRTVDVDLAAGINEETNPALRDYDTIIVSRNGAAVAGDNLETILAPFNSVVDAFDSFFGILDTVNLINND